MRKIKNTLEDMNNFSREMKHIFKNYPKRNIRGRKHIRAKKYFDDLISRLDIRENEIS